MIKLGKLQEIKDLRKAWPHEAHDFTPWLAENINILSDTIGIDISIEETESPVGGFNADIFATDADTGRRIIIENQLEETNHDHLGKLITYASGKSASLVIWVVKKAREEHRSAIEWLNNHTDDDIGFILCQIKLLKINDSDIAPMFEIIEQPNNWAKVMKKSSGPRRVTSLPKIRDMLEWGAVSPGDVLIAKDTSSEVILLDNGHVTFEGEETSMQNWLRKVYGWKSVETYRFAVHKNSGKSLSQIRKEYMESYESADEE